MSTVPLAHDGKNSHLRDGVRVKVMELHPIIVHESPHKPACQDPEALVVEREEAHHITLWRIGSPRVRSRDDPFREIQLEAVTKKIGINAGLERGLSHIGHGLWVGAVEHGCHSSISFFLSFLGS